jgi:hypothetical protein
VSTPAERVAALRADLQREKQGRKKAMDFIVDLLLERAEARSAKLDIPRLALALAVVDPRDPLEAPRPWIDYQDLAGQIAAEYDRLASSYPNESTDHAPAPRHLVGTPGEGV